MSATWLERALISHPHYIALCLRPKDFERELKKLKVPKSERPPYHSRPGVDCTVWTIEAKGGKVCSFVNLGPCKGRSREEVYGLLVHEAVHLWQQWRDHAGERAPSIEFEAYAVQALAQNLMQAYKDAK